MGQAQPPPHRGTGCGVSTSSLPVKDPWRRMGLSPRVTEGSCGLHGAACVSRAGHHFSCLPAKEAHKPPVFLEKLQNTGVADGYPVRLECRVSGAPPPQIFWKKENESLTHSTDRVR